jgi:isoaspartyl peptidase/L-asparaginase-like protein (Ntn-hydrolase superfamily)
MEVKDDMEAFGAVTGFTGRNAISEARSILENGRQEREFGLIPPLMVTYKRKESAHKDLITARQKERFDKLVKFVNVQDTVGAVCIDFKGDVVAGVSSGGIWLKQEGRIGEAAVYGAGCYANRYVGTSVTGTGEQVIRKFAAKSISDLQSIEATSKWLSEFKTSNANGMRMYKERNIGFISLSTRNECTELMFGHTTESLVLAYGSEKSFQFLFSVKQPQKDFLLCSRPVTQ